MTTEKLPGRLVQPLRLAYLGSVVYNGSTDDLLQKVWDGARINQQEALSLSQLPLEELGAIGKG